MECPACYTSKTTYKLLCGHSFCYRCITHWYQECRRHTCPICRQDICFELNENIREVHVQCAPNSKIDDYVTFHKLLEKFTGYHIKDVAYLKRQDWVEWVMEHRAKEQLYTKYIFYGLQGTKETSHQKRQEEQKTCIFSKAHKD